MKSYFHASVEVAHKYLTHISDEAVLRYHPVVISVENLQQPLTYNPRQITILNERNPVQALLSGVLLTCRDETSEGQVAIEVFKVGHEGFLEELSVKLLVIVLN